MMSMHDTLCPAQPVPVLARLCRELESRWGIKAADDALVKLRDYAERRHGERWFTLPGIYETLFSEDTSAGDIARLVTVNETYFFREPAHFTLLLEKVLPEFSRPLKICSAATATGCEAYSIAMTIEAYNRKTPVPLPYSIDAFDINGAVIETARQGRYGKNSIREDGSQFRYLLDRYIKPAGEEFTVDPSLGKHIHFFRHNIMEGLSGSAYDLIFFRNAVIYFSHESRARLLSNLAAALDEQGVLIMGVSETAGVNHPLLLSVGDDVFYFRKNSPAKG
jgi:chemotaxis protein methyltransferase CheR